MTLMLNTNYTVTKRFLLSLKLNFGINYNNYIFE